MAHSESLKSKVEENWKVSFLIFLCFLIVLAVGLLTYPCLGDETSFFRLAQGFFQTHERLTIDPVYYKSHLVYFYNSEPLWPAVLGGIWTLLGKQSLAVAQIYQAGFFLGLLYFTYLFSKQLTDSNQAFLTLLILATTPMVAAFGILFYVEIPMMAFLMLAVYLFYRGKLFLAALVLSVAFLTKMTVLFFLPAFLWHLFRNENSFKKKFSQAVLFTIPVLITAIGDGIWRHTHLNVTALFSNVNEEGIRQSGWQALKDRALMGDAAQRLSEYADSGLWEYTNSSLLNGLDALKYFGIVALVLGAVFIWRKKYKQVRFISPFILSYFAGFAYTCILAPDVRYLLPIAPFLAIVGASVAVSYWERPVVKFLIMGLCFLQFGGSVATVLKERRVTPEIQEGFKFIEEAVPEEALTIYPEYVFIDRAHRGVIWSHRFRDKLIQLFWEENKKPVLDYFISRNIIYLAVKKNRIYDDSKRRHFGGYPQSFITEMEHSPYFERLFENKEISIWKLQNGAGEKF